MEQDLYKCQKHPSRVRRTGICPTCLRDRLNLLCPDCAHARPCTCPTTSTSSSFFPETGRVGTLIAAEPAVLRRSRSLTVTFFRRGVWPALRLKKKKKEEHVHAHEDVMRRSKSVAVEREGKGSGKVWDFHFPSPMKVLRLSSKVLVNHQQHSPFCTT